MLFPAAFASGSGDPPPIGAARLESAAAPIRPLLVWVRTGAAHVHLDDAAVSQVTFT